MGEIVGAWGELCLRGVAGAREAVARLGEAAGRRVVTGHAEAYRAEDPETIGVDEAAEAQRRSLASGWRRSPTARPMERWGEGEAALASGTGEWSRS